MAHPRACGENRDPRHRELVRRGSSPRVRGKPPSPTGKPGTPRLIPARAGKTAPNNSQLRSSTAHPRACGENAPACCGLCHVVGSSPRVRGKRRSPRRRPPRGRLIPARAGKTDSTPTRCCTTTAHPRACGENLSKASRLSTKTGSSPRVRGKHAMIEEDRHKWRLIPARAGKTLAAAHRVAAPVAHPRACGENTCAPRRSASVSGSSPRVRGKRYYCQGCPFVDGLIPARAGKTRCGRARHRHRWAHPRACGENDILAGDTRAATGSSPRVRGKLVGATL